MATSVLPIAPVTKGARRASRAPAPALVVVATAIGLVFASPLVYLVEENVSLGRRALDVATSSATTAPLARTLALAITVSVSATVLGSLLAWLVTRTDLPGRRFWRVAAPVPLAVPSFVGAAAVVAAFAPGGLLSELLAPLGVESLPRVRGFGAAVGVLTVLTYPFVYLPVAARLSALPPSLEEAARLLGRSPSSVFRSVVWPQVAPAVWAGALLVCLYSLAEFGAVHLLRYDTLTRAIYSSRLVPSRAVPMSLVLGVVAIVVVVAERAIARRVPAMPSVRTRTPLVVPLGRWRVPALAVVAATLCLALGVPVLVLGFWALRGLADAQTAAGDLAGPALRTALAGTAAAAAATFAVLPIARLAGRRRGTAGEVPSALVVAGYALPGIVIALALVSWVLRLPEWLGLYQSFGMLVFAYVVHFGAQSMRAANVAVGAVPARLEEAARVLGAGRVRRLASVELPLMAPGLIAGAAMVLLSTVKELPATLLLAPIGFDTLATRVWQASSEGFLAEAGITGVALIGVSSLLTWLLVVRRGEHFG